MKTNEPWLLTTQAAEGGRTPFWMDKVGSFVTTFDESFAFFFTFTFAVKQTAKQQPHPPPMQALGIYSDILLPCKMEGVFEDSGANMWIWLIQEVAYIVSNQSKLQPQHHTIDEHISWKLYYWFGATIET